jgi:hypothetical protein
VQTTGTLSITSGSASATTLDVFASTLPAGGNALLGRVVAGGFNGNAVFLSEGANTLFQVTPWHWCETFQSVCERVVFLRLQLRTNGLATFPKGGIVVQQGGMTTVSGLFVTGTVADITGDTVQHGSVSISSAVATGPVVAILDNTVGYSGNLIQGRSAAGVVDGNALFLTDSTATDTLLQVRGPTFIFVGSR